MDCRDIMELLHDFARKRLEPTLHRQVAEHLKNCPACREELRRVRRYYDAIGREGAVPPPPDFLDATMNRIRRKSSPLRRLLGMIALPTGPGIPLGAAGLAVASVIAVFLIRPAVLFHEGSRPAAPGQVAVLDTVKEPMSVHRIRRVLRTRADSIPSAGQERATDSLLAKSYSLRTQMKDEVGATANDEAVTAQDTMEIALNVLTLPAGDESAVRSRDEEKSLREFSGVPPSAVLGGSTATRRIEHWKQKIPDIGAVVTSQQGTITGSRQSGNGTIYQILLPREQYGAFIRELGKIGNLKSPGAADRTGKVGAIELNLTIQGTR
ncbi:MAG: zf-HC2 domain-containing protein [Spirochaetes bacterium]|nr:zf-HC2 domain-containing protein [Spirochaetota bacterium]